MILITIIGGSLSLPISNDIFVAILLCVSEHALVTCKHFSSAHSNTKIVLTGVIIYL